MSKIFQGGYFDWNEKRLKGIINFFGGHEWFWKKQVLDLGSGHADISGCLYRLGADITALDARQSHLQVISKKFSGIKIVKADLDGAWPFYGKSFDLILDLGLLCHLSSFESHLKAVCASTSTLVLETAVCDSYDPNKCVKITENKAIYDLSINGTGCRPSTASIERVLRNCGMDFKRVDKASFNSGNYVYDWPEKNDDSISFNHRRIWFAQKNGAPIVDGTKENVGARPAMGFVSPLKEPDSPRPRLRVSPKPPMSNLARQNGANTNYVRPAYSPNKALSFDNIRTLSKEFSLITPETFTAPLTFPIEGGILPISIESKQWTQKIAPFFPNLRIHQSAIAMQGFTKTNSNDLTMCAIDSLISANRLWIEEWSPKIELNDDQVAILKTCTHILTPSLLNAQAILKRIPEANISRVGCPYPMLSAPGNKIDQCLYIEKCPAHTNILFQVWEKSFGNLLVIGSQMKLPPFATFVSDCRDYSSLIRDLAQSKALIDLPANGYYLSGILELAKSIGTTVITTNTGVENAIQISPDKSMTYDLKPVDLTNAIRIGLETPSPAINSQHNNSLNEALNKLLGKQG